MRAFQIKKLIIGNIISLEIIGQEEEEEKACYKFELFGPKMD